MNNKLILSAVLAIFCASPLYAQSGFDGAAQEILNILTGGLARTIAIIAVVALGVSAMTGRINWRWGFSIIIGIILIFSGATIVDMIAGSV